jgi:hypothetical protein
MNVVIDASRSSGKSPYREYVDLLLNLHTMIRADIDESPEGDDLRDKMDEPWHRMSQDELNRVDAVASDLNSLLPDSPFYHPSKGGIQCRDVAHEIKAARQYGDYEGILKRLRDRPECVSADRAAFLRGWCYERLSEPEVAAMFFEHAAMLDQDNDLYAIFVPNQPISQSHSAFPTPDSTLP